MSTATPETLTIEREQLNPCTVRLEITCGGALVKEAFTKVVKNYAKQIRVPGFRPGQAPRSIVERQVSPEAITEGAADELIRKAYPLALEKEGITPDGAPSVELKKLDEAGGVAIFAVKVPLPPIAELGEYRGLKVEAPTSAVSEEDVDYALNRLQQRGGKRETVTDRGASEGDNAVVNIKPDGDEEGRTFMVIVGQTFPELDQALLTLGPEEMRRIELTFPENFQEADWKGKKLAVTLTLRSLTSMRLPGLDDDFARSLKADNLDALRTRVREQVGQAKIQMVQNVLHERLLEKVLETSQIEIADTTWESVIRTRMRELVVGLRNQNKTLEDYCQENGMTVEQYEDALRKEAVEHVKRAVAIEHIFRKEEMKLTHDDLNEHFLEIAREQNVPQEKLREFAKENAAELRNEAVFRAMHAKVMRFLREQAVITETASA